MGQWTRNTKWRQGSILPPGAAALALGLVGEDDNDEPIFIVASHDCDVACANLALEPEVEFVRGRVVASIVGELTKAKNVRLLHLEFNTAAGPKCVEFNTGLRIRVPKDRLADFSPAEDWELVSSKGQASFRWWLAARYFRSSFSDTFDARLSKSKIDRKIDQALSPCSKDVYGIFFLVDDGAESSLPENISHVLRSVIVYASETISDEDITKIKAAAEKIERAFKKEFYDSVTHVWSGIELMSCDVVSDEVFSWANARVFKQWRLEFRSFADDNLDHPLPIGSV
jgi:hypothetical protein